MKEDFKSYTLETSSTESRYCPTCNKECKEGQAMWNGWFVREKLYHWECVPEKLKERYLK